ncbi:MAG: helix-turn-helix transcriptional regulator [Streptosporangiaceae bacterium]|nr:helix-turn-helix transcriptional regulator [Streptosporangiaceae bacterium]
MYVPLSGLQQAVRLVDSLTELDDPAGFADLVLPGLARLIGCESVSYNEIGPETGQVKVDAYPHELLSPARVASFAAFAHEHPLVVHYRLTGDDGPVRVSDVLSQERFHRLGLYNELFRYIPVEHQIAFSLRSSPPGSAGQVVGIALNRARGDFTEDDRALLSVLRCPLVTALERARRRQHAREGLAAANSSALDELTDREMHVLRLAALGRTNTAIAHALDVSPRTVAKHLEHIYRKLDVSSRASAVFTALASHA